MKKSAMLLVFAVVMSVGIAVKLSTHEKAAGAPQASHEQTATRINKEFDIAAGSVESVSFTAPGRPGTLSGKWHASGKSGHDAALSGFTLTDPSDAVLDSAFKGSSGSFQVKVSAAGKHTFFFENAGKKQTPRHVTLDAEFTPD
ncbi:MAG TPA: hypothetical protein VIR54_32845 [Vicinamibacterales bacterium]|jgi:hypothetical protein